MRHKHESIPVIPSKDVVIGEKSAPVKLELFGDYESVDTLKANKVVTALLDDYESKVNFVYRHFPLTRIHQKAHKAAEAAIGAAQEEKFWEFHQHLFENRQNLGVISLKSYAREVGVKDKKFLDHLINGDWGWFVQDDIREGLERGVTDIPVLFINGVRYEEGISLNGLKSYIDGLLKPANSKVVTLKKSKSA
jgi:protein-disulfide isomerase